uniref:Uncharacterized protein n=1 Tax=Anguilla anguilla TaxID=7936 RepID=A0A0E9VNU7_ANGAN
MKGLGKPKIFLGGVYLLDPKLPTSKITHNIVATPLALSDFRSSPYSLVLVGFFLY